METLIIDVKNKTAERVTENAIVYPTITKEMENAGKLDHDKLKAVLKSKGIISDFSEVE